MSLGTKGTGRTAERREAAFRVTRAAGRTLVDQVYEGLRHAIVCGRYAPGELLPSTRELAVALGVSRIVTRAAVKRLAENGFISPRVGSGCLVLRPGTRVWRGHVLAAVPHGYESFFQNMLLGSLSDGLTEAGYLFSQVTVPYTEEAGFDFAHLDSVLAQGIDLVCTFHNKDPLFAHLAAGRTPYAAIMGGRKTEKGAVGTVRMAFAQAVPGFVKACRARRVKSVVQVSWADGMADAVPALRRAGVRARDLRLAVDDAEGRIVGAQTAALRAFLDWTTPWPDVLFFNDDNLAVGALTALLARGVRIPGDVSVATWSNRFLRPAFPRPLARMEVDPVAAGRTAAAAVVAYLRNGTFPPDVSFGPVWMDGETLGPLGKEKQT